VKTKVQLLFAAAIILLIGIGLNEARQWNSATALFPHVVGYPALILAIIILVLDYRATRRQDKTRKDAENAEFAAVNIRLMRYIGWLIGLVIFAWAIGIVPTVAIYIFGYMKIEGKYSWLASTCYAVAMAAFIFILFEKVLGVAWPEGALLGMLGIG